MEEQPRSMSERITYAMAVTAVKLAARASGLDLDLESEGTVGRGPGYSIVLGPARQRLAVRIGTLRETYEDAHLITNTAYAMRSAKGERPQPELA